jgi:4a-hydroxytetrahydrobiopterin dehydratase
MLKDSKCTPDKGGQLRLGNILNFMQEIKDWNLENNHLVKYFEFGNFKDSVDFMNKVAGIAHDAGHSPAMLVNDGQLKIELWTRAIGGLSENDFILAAKIDSIS